MGDQEREGTSSRRAAKAGQPDASSKGADNAPPGGNPKQPARTSNFFLFCGGRQHTVLAARRGGTATSALLECTMEQLSGRDSRKIRARALLPTWGYNSIIRNSAAPGIR
eukprot:EG_transcript_61330